MNSRLERIAYEESLKARDTKQFFGCLILQRKRVQSRGHNFRSFDYVSCCCHAEMDAMYRHLSMLGRWREFYRVLKLSYRYTGVLREISNETREILRGFLSKIKSGKREKFKMFVFRFYSSGECSNAKPCAECSRWIWIARHLGIEYDIYYTSDRESLVRFRGDGNTYSPTRTYF